MPIIFKHTADTGSNKTAKFDVQLIANAYWYKRPTEYTVSVHKPIIDRMSFTFPVTDTLMRKCVRSWLLAESKKPGSSVNKWTKLQDWGSQQYHHSFAINCSKGTPVLLQIEAENPGTAFLRVEFNPNAIGPNGMGIFQDSLSKMFGGAFTYLDIAAGCKVTRFDVAVDLVNIDVEDLLITTTKPGKTMSYFSLAGKKETAYLNIKKKGSNLYVYDRKALIEKLFVEGSGQPSEFGEAPYTRIECRVKPDKPITSLPKSHNPFKKIGLIDIEAPASPEAEHHWRLFQDSCRYRGVAGALNQLPEGTRDEYQAALDAVSGDLWRPQKLWEHWEDTLTKSGVLPT